MNSNTLLADPAAIEIEKFISLDDEITIVVRSVQPTANCPRCGCPSSSLKARYLRQIADLPWHGVAVRLQLKTRKFRCYNALCAGKVFCERLPRVVARYARRTSRLVEALTVPAFALGGRGGARAAGKLSFSTVGKDTLLRLMRCSSAYSSQPFSTAIKVLETIKQLQANGKTIRAIARELRASRNTVRRYVYCEDVPRHRAGRRSAVLPFAAYLERRWRMGEHNGFQLWREIKEQGFSGEIDAVRRFVREWRKTDVGKTSCPITARGLAPRHAAKLLLYPASTKSDSERLYLKTLRGLSSKVTAIERLGSGFQQMVLEKRAEPFDDWLKEVETSDIPELKSWANGLLADEAAVRNALSSEWSNGQTEGQVNRLKTIKRQMYGRAKFDLLRARVLHRT